MARIFDTIDDPIDNLDEYISLISSLHNFKLIELPQDLPESQDLDERKAFLYGVFVGNLKADRVALSPAITPRSRSAYRRWSRYIPPSLSSAILSDFRKHFADPIMKAVNPSPSSLSHPRNHCKQADYLQQLSHMHEGVILSR